MFGLLDLLATVATETLNNDESLKNVTTRPMSPNVDFRQESTKTSVKNPRRLTDFDVFGFHQVTDAPLSYKYSDLSQD